MKKIESGELKPREYPGEKEKLFSLYENGILNTNPKEDITILEFIETLKNNPHKGLIEKISKEKVKEKRQTLKRDLSYVTFAGSFIKRGKKSLKKSSGFACLDFDDIEEGKEEEVKKKLINNKYTHLVFKSPSGKGFKLVVKIPSVKDDEEYLKYWLSIENHYNLPSSDEANKDISRACYVSIDLNYYFNPDSEIYTEKVEKKIIDTTSNQNESNELSEKIKSKVSMEQLLREFGVDTSMNPTNCPFHNCSQPCLSFDNEVCNCFDTDCGRGYNIFSFVQKKNNFTSEESMKWLSDFAGLSEEFEENKEKYEEGKINWLDGDWFNSWDKIKAYSKKKWGSGKEYIEEPPKWFFLTHSNDIIRGKPQLIEQVQRKIPLIRLAVRKVKCKLTENLEGFQDIQKFYFFDEKFDKRYDGFQRDCFALDFWFYRIISEEGKEYYILTQEKLPNCTCNFKGMLVELDDFAEMSRSLKMKSLSKMFFMKSFEPDIKILTKEQLITYTKEREINEGDWLDFLAYHSLGTYNRFPEETEKLKSAFLLSGKFDKQGLHLGVFGQTGTRKSMGLIETTAYKFDEDPTICEGANSRIKALMPSFKEKPANIGYLAKCERIGFIDEIGKMVEFEVNKHQTNINNVLGDLNFLLDHKKRLVGSGNDNDCEVQATAKFMFVTNPISNRRTIYDHVGLIDPTTMSRILWWVQDPEEKEFVLGKKGVIRVPPTPKQDQDISNLTKNKKKYVLLKKCWGKIGSREEFLSLFDTCYSFICELDDTDVSKLVNLTIQLAKEPMKTSVWKPRAHHHVYLLVDGLVKHRCLFKDYDNTFTAKQEDYDLAERILIRMIKGWDTDLSPKSNFSDGRL